MVVHETQQPARVGRRHPNGDSAYALLEADAGGHADGTEILVDQ